MKKTKVNTVILDDHLLFAEGLARILDDIPSIELIRIIHTSQELFELLPKYELGLLLLDVQLKNENGIDICKLIKENSPETKVILISMFDYNDLSSEIRKCLANGYIPKSIDAENVKETILEVLNGNNVFIHSDEYTFQPQPYFKLITTREKEIITLIKEGFSSKQISEKLHISPYTVDTHRKNILKKLNLNSVKDLIAFAIHHNL